MIRTSKLGMLSFIIVIIAVTTSAVGSNGDDFAVPLNDTWKGSIDRLPKRLNR
jgi:hypothetical protein